ncbi:hypothetical protein XOCgx_1971 [Xanthomonas oryzae pv. oryzicola]|nr:hypothetical protein XOCgx_1971 [Xanthomonas oryzae pv. oryzicola]
MPSKLELQLADTFEEVVGEVLVNGHAGIVSQHWGIHIGTRRC